MKHTELLNLDMNKVNEVESEKIMEYFDFEEGTPFTGVKKEGGKWLLVMGDSLVTNKSWETTDEMVKYVESKPYELIVVAAVIFMNQTKKREYEKDIT